MGKLHPVSEISGRSITSTILDILRAQPIGTALYKTDIVKMYSDKYGYAATDYIHVIINIIERAGYIKQIDRLTSKVRICIIKELPKNWGEVHKRATSRAKDDIETILLDNSKIKDAEPGKIYPIQFIFTTQVNYITGQVLTYLVQYIKSGYTDNVALKGAVDLLVVARAYNIIFRVFTGKTKLLYAALNTYIEQEKLPPLLKDCVINMQESNWTVALEIIQKISAEAIANKG